MSACQNNVLCGTSFVREDRARDLLLGRRLPASLSSLPVLSHCSTFCVVCTTYLLIKTLGIPLSTSSLARNPNAIASVDTVIASSQESLTVLTTFTTTMSAISAERQEAAEATPKHQPVEEQEGSPTSGITKDERRNAGHVIQDLDGLALGLAYFLSDLRHDTRCLTDSEPYDILRWLDEVPDVCMEIPADYIGSIWRSLSCKDVKTVTLPACGRSRAGSAPELLDDEDCEFYAFSRVF